MPRGWLEVIHLVRMHEGGSRKNVRHCAQGEVFDTPKYVRKWSLFARIFKYLHTQEDTFITVVFGDDFHYCFIKHLVKAFSCLSNALQSLSMELLIGCSTTFPLEMGGPLGKSTYAMGGRSKRTCAYERGGEGQTFPMMGRTY